MHGLRNRLELSRCRGTLLEQRTEIRRSMAGYLLTHRQDSAVSLYRLDRLGLARKGTILRHNDPGAKDGRQNRDREH